MYVQTIPRMTADERRAGERLRIASVTASVLLVTTIIRFLVVGLTSLESGVITSTMVVASIAALGVYVIHTLFQSGISVPREFGLVVRTLVVVNVVGHLMWAYAQFTLNGGQPF